MRFRALLLLAALPLSAQQVCSKTQTPAEIDARIDQLIAQMTVPERIAQLGDRAPSIPRLHLPGYNWWSEGLHGIARNGYATVFPQAIGLAATFDPALMQAVGDTIATEARAKFNAATNHGQLDAERNGGLTLWSPNINIFRDPRWGRGQETYGEDPFLTAALGTGFVRGLQGNDPFYLKADATPKHFAAHSGPEEGRDSFNAPATPHDLADTYLPAFHALTTDAHAAAIMCSYNAIDGTPSCANADLLQTRVRDLWHFPGYVVSDCDAVGNIASFHKFAPDNAHGAALALKAGTDLDCGSTYTALNQALAQHLITEQEIDRSLHRLLFARLHLGLLDTPSCNPYDTIAATEIDSPAHRLLALQAAEESIVLLKNDGILPLASGKKIAVIGPTADLLSVLEANYHGTIAHPLTQLDLMLAAFPTAKYAQGSVLATGLPIAIPRTALRNSAGPKAAEGLLAEFFPAPTLTGTPILTTTVSTLDLDLDRVTPDARVPQGPYAARWSGVLVPPAPGDYTLTLHVDRCWDCAYHDSFRLFVDNRLAVNYPGGTARFPSNTSVKLTAADTKPHPIRVEYIHTGEDEGLSLQWEPPAVPLLDEATRAAAGADVLVAFVGLSPDLEGENFPIKIAGFDGGDRTSLNLPDAQADLLDHLRGLGKPIIVVLNSGSAVALDPHKANALLAAWYPGEEGPHALADIVLGITNPSGRLPVTFFRSTADLPPFTDYSMAHRTYRYFDGPVLFPFGFGLSYTTFSYTGLHLDRTSINAGDPLTATVKVTNTGSRDGEEVAELYLTPPTKPGSPRLTLQGIQRVSLAPNESRILTFTLSPDQLSFIDERGHRAIRPGDYRLTIGGTQPNPNQPAATVHITGEKLADF